MKGLCMMLEEQGIYYFHQGTNYYSYKLLGAHYQKDVTIFRVWAPNAKKVSVIGEFNNWNRLSNPMVKINESGIWEAKIENIEEYSSYKYAILTKKNCWINKSDPYAFHSEIRPATASKVFNLNNYKFNDEAWMNLRNIDIDVKPVNIYEVNLGTWRQYTDGNFFDYQKLAHELADYLNEMGYTHVEIMPITEFPFDKSWGYQVTGFFAITSRYGSPNDFKAFVDILHQHNIGVIVDWVPGHFCKDAHGLIEFDGSYLYEPSDSTKREHSGWGTRTFDYGRPEIQSFLVSNAVFLFNEYHIDGLRVDAVASMLYLDYGRKANEWHPNSFGTNINLDAVAFLQKLNATVHELCHNPLMIAEESTTFPKMTVSTKDGGLGFDYKWNMGWMNDTLSYIKTDPIYRSYLHNKITFQMSYIYSEKFILALSHDEVVHGKCSLLSKMPGTYEQKFAGLQTYLMYMMSHPGKKLNFMGYEIAQFIEWKDDAELDWILLGYDMHAKFHNFVKKLNHFYLENRPFYENERNWNGFKWIITDDSNNNVFVYERYDNDGNKIVVVLNFSFSSWNDYHFHIENGNYEIVLASNTIEYGGVANIIGKKIRVKNNTIAMNIPAICGIYLKKVGK